MLVYQPRSNNIGCPRLGQALKAVVLSCPCLGTCGGRVMFPATKTSRPKNGKNICSKSACPAYYVQASKTRPSWTYPHKSKQDYCRFSCDRACTIPTKEGGLFSVLQEDLCCTPQARRDYFLPCKRACAASYTRDLSFPQEGPVLVQYTQKRPRQLPFCPSRGLYIPISTRHGLSMDGTTVGWVNAADYHY